MMSCVLMVLIGCCCADLCSSSNSIAPEYPIAKDAEAAVDKIEINSVPSVPIEPETEPNQSQQCPQYHNLPSVVT